MKKCSQCGKENIDDAVFCRFCGARFPELVESDEKAVTQNTTTKKKFKKSTIAACCILGVLAAGIVGKILYDASEDAETVQVTENWDSEVEDDEQHQESSGNQVAKKSQPSQDEHDQLYFPYWGDIGVMDSETGDVSVLCDIPTVDGMSPTIVSDISAYNGMIYCCVNFTQYDGEDTGVNYICRLRSDGSDFQTLMTGESPIVYEGRLYYISDELRYDDDMECDYSVPYSLCVCDLDGMNEECLNYFTEDLNIINASMTISDDQIYLISNGYDGDNAVNEGSVFSLNGDYLDGLWTSNAEYGEWGQDLYVSNNEVFFISDYDYTVYQFLNEDDVCYPQAITRIERANRFLGVYDGYIYYSNSEEMSDEADEDDEYSEINHVIRRSLTNEEDEYLISSTEVWAYNMLAIDHNQMILATSYIDNDSNYTDSIVVKNLNSNDLEDYWFVDTTYFP